VNLRMALAGLVVVILAAGIAVGLIVWEPWDGGGGANDANSLTLRLNEGDLQKGAELLGRFLPDFDCSREWDEESKKGALVCTTGVTGFRCTLEAGDANARASVGCGEGAQGLDAPTCSMLGQDTVLCSGPSTNAICVIRAEAEPGTISVSCNRP
jgi:hypothetical protein